MIKINYLSFLCLTVCIVFHSFANPPQRVGVFSQPFSSDISPVPLIGLNHNHLFTELWTTDTALPVDYEYHHALDSNHNVDSHQIENADAAPCIIGNACDDGNPNTVNDRYDANCDCIGDPIAMSCEEVGISYEVNGGLREVGAAAITISQTDTIELFANLSAYEVRDPNGNIVPGNKIENIVPSQAGNYTVNTAYRTATALPKVYSVSSQQVSPGVENGIEKAFDGDPTTFWHSQYLPAPAKGYPHTLILDMGEGAVLSGFNYLPRDGSGGGGTNGRVGNYEIYVSNSPEIWGAAVATGTFPNTSSLQTVRFTARHARYLRFIAMGPAISGQVWASAAELSVLKGGPATASSNGTMASNATDNNISTIWQTATGATGSPHITLDLGIESNVTGIEYTPRQTGTDGKITSFDVFVSNSPTDFGAPVATGTWDYMTNPIGLRTAPFAEKKGRYVRLVSKTGTVASAAEFKAICPTVNIPCSKTITINVDPRTTYSFNNGTWTPPIPPAGTTPNDFIIINEGDATFESAVACRNLIVNPGASLTLKTGGVLTATSTILKSKSNSYSSLIVDGGELIGILNYERWVNQRGTAAGGGNDLISAPVSYATFNNAFRIVNSNLPENQSNLGEFAFAPYNVTAGAYQNFNIGSDYTGDIPLVPGVGYRAATNVISPQTGNTLTFSGTPTATVVTVPLSGAAKGRAWNLIGNPYPSYLNFETFFEANKDQFNANGAYQAIYGYTGASATWTVWNEATILDPEIETSMTPGQGFFVKSKSGGGTVTFTPAMQITGNSDDFILGRPKKNVALSKIRLSSGNLNGMTSIYFIDGTTKGMDPGYDAAAYGATPVNFSIFTNLVEESQGLDMAIQTLPYDDFNNVVVPLGVKAKAGSELSINIDDLSTIPPHINVYLEDTEEHTWTLLNSGAYAFSLSKDINNAKRFKVHYSARTLSLDDVQSNTKLRIYTISGSKSLFVTGQLNKAATAQLYDIQGRMVLSQALNAKSTENVIDISTVSAGIYVVKVANNNDVITQKVIIN